MNLFRLKDGNSTNQKFNEVVSKQAYKKMLKQIVIVSCVIVGGFASPTSAGAFDGNGFELHVARLKSLSDLNFSWRVRPPFNYDAFNVRVQISDGRENQHETAGRTQGHWVERNADAGLIYTFKVQGCDKGTFGSKCTPWSQIRFKNIRGNDIVDGP